MTDNTMREGKLWAFLRDSIHEAYKKLSTTGTSNEYHALLDSIASKVADDVDARFLQVAQAEPVEVFDSRCNYASFAGRVCNKCGRIHDGGLGGMVGGEQVKLWRDERIGRHALIEPLEWFAGGYACAKSNPEQSVPKANQATQERQP